MHLFKANILEFEFDRHLEHMFSYQEIQSGLSVFFGGLNSALSRFSCNRDCLDYCTANLFRISPTGNIKIRSYL